MNVTLNSPFEKFVKKLVETGRYESEQQVIEAGIANLVLDNLDAGSEQVEDDVLQSIEGSETQIRNGKVRTLDEAVKELHLKHFGR